tara:strand:- start:206 stop:688 length:483 start_codon:yes stop_codon:yes gene_type:complete
MATMEEILEDLGPFVNMLKDPELAIFNYFKDGMSIGDRDENHTAVTLPEEMTPLKPGEEYVAMRTDNLYHIIQAAIRHKKTANPPPGFGVSVRAKAPNGEVDHVLENYTKNMYFGDVESPQRFKLEELEDQVDPNCKKLCLMELNTLTTMVRYAIDNISY